MFYIERGVIGGFNGVTHVTLAQPSKDNTKADQKPLVGFMFKKKSTVCLSSVDIPCLELVFISRIGCGLPYKERLALGIPTVSIHR